VCVAGPTAEMFRITAKMFQINKACNCNALMFTFDIYLGIKLMSSIYLLSKLIICNRLVV